MLLASFYRNCLADAYLEAAAEQGTQISKDEARERIYGEPFAEWKAKYQPAATQEQLDAYDQLHRNDH